MSARKAYRTVKSIVLGICLGGTVAGLSCNSDTLEAAAVGLDAASQQLDAQSSNNFSLTDLILNGLNGSN